jgi:hypothetical protein
MRSKLIHKLFLGFLMGIALGFVLYFAVNNFVVSTNAQAITSQLYARQVQVALNQTTIQLPIVQPYDPPWAYPLGAFAFGFIVPVAGIISLDMDERLTESPAQPASSTLVIETGPNLTHIASYFPAIAEMLKAQGQAKPEGPPGK